MSAKAEKRQAMASALLRAGEAFREMHAALDKAQDALTETDPFWLMQYSTQANMHHTQGRAYAASAKDLGAGEDLLRLAAGGDLKGLEKKLLR